METRPFDLQSEIKNYFNRLHTKANLSPGDEIELEGHIHDGVGSLAEKGLSVEEAFLITIRRMGKIDMLSEEYNKVNPFFVSDKIRSYFITGLGLILSLGTIFLLIYELISTYWKTYLGRTSIDMAIRSVLYVGLCFAVLAAFKWGRSLFAFLKISMERSPVLTALLLFLVPFLNFLLQPVLFGVFGSARGDEGFNYKLVDSSNIQFINLSFYLLILSVLFLILISFWVTTGKRQGSQKRPIIFLILFGVVISMAAVMVRYIPENNSGLQNSIFLALVYTIGSFSIAFHNNDKLWLKFFIFFAFSLGLGNLLVEVGTH